MLLKHLIYKKTENIIITKKLTLRMKKIELPLFNNWTKDNIAPCNWSNWRRYKNYFAIVTMYENGKEGKNFMQPSKDCDLYFNAVDVKPNDILVASCWDDRKNRQRKHYYIVVDKASDILTLAEGYGDVDFSTSLTAFKARKRLLEEGLLKESQPKLRNYHPIHD